MDLIRFDQDDIENVLAKMSDTEIDDLAFGAIELNPSGEIVRYNAAESSITGRDQTAVIGQNFFDTVAPCTKTPEFYGRFEGIKAGKETNVMFTYTFDYQMAPTKVNVHMKKSLANENIWIFVKRV